jgi:hypothetical protein
VSLARASNWQHAITSASASTRGVRAPARSPKASRWASLRWTTRPAGSRRAEIRHRPPSTRRASNRPSSVSRCRRPLRRGKRTVSGPTAAANASAAPARSYALQASSTTSNGPRTAPASTVGGERRVTSPKRLSIVKPVSASRAAQSGRTRNVTSRPASSRRPPKYPPVAPAPTTSMRTGHLPPPRLFVRRQRHPAAAPMPRKPPVSSDAPRQLVGPGTESTAGPAGQK